MGNQPIQKGGWCSLAYMYVRKDNVLGGIRTSTLVIRYLHEYQNQDLSARWNTHLAEDNLE